MQLATFLKNVRRLGRLNARTERLAALTTRASEAGDTATVDAYAKEGKRRAAEMNFLALRVEADLEDHPEWTDAAAAMSDAVTSGSRGSADAKALMAAALAAGAGPTAEAAAE